ncbi:MAG: restriction endonuclease subunit S [Actinobacteria bacterium]|nr:restriction endonuclease subunit S [Actinomycetota bacterium]
MTRVGALLAELAPSGVPVLPLGDVGSFMRGRRFTKADTADDGLPSIHYGEIYTHYGVAASQALTHLRSELAPTLRFAETNDVIIAAVGETVEDVGKSVAWLGSERVAVHDDCFIFRSHLDPKYVVYYMQSEAFNKPKETYVTRAKVKRLSSRGLERLRIPVPPIEVQREIVRVLDLFTELDVELGAELRARRRQFMTYRDRLLWPHHVPKFWPDGTELVSLGSVAARFVSPLRVQSDDTYTNLGVKWYGEGAFAREPKTGRTIKGKTLYRVRPRQFIYNRMFVTEGAFGLVTPGLADGVVSSEFPVYDLDAAKVSPEWLYLRFQDPATVRTVAAETTGATKSRRRWKEDQFESFTIELPPLESQLEVVRILDAFAQLVAELEVEIAARRKQYQYYRDRLLTFEELVS